MCNAFYCRVQKSIFIKTKFAIFRDKYLSQDLIVILRNITRLCQVSQRGVGALPRQTAGIHEHLPSYHKHWPDGVLMLCRRRRWRASIRTTLGQCLVSAGLRSQLISKHNVSLIVAYRLQHWAGINPALANQYIGLNKINVHQMLAYCWPIVYDHGSAVKQHWLKVLFLQGTPATQYPDTMLEECHRWWHNI